MVYYISNFQVKKAKKGTIYTQSQVKKLAEKHPLSLENPKNFRLGQAIKPRIIKARFVRWPRYVQIQRKKRILLRRLKVPPAIAQFMNPMDKATTTTLFKTLQKYTPETKKEKKDRLKGLARKTIRNLKSNKEKKPIKLKFGLNHVTYLIEQKKAKLVIIASDVDPIETVIHLPTLCRQYDVPFCIVQNKARLGELVNKKTATVLALTDFDFGQADLNNIARKCTTEFNNALPQYKRPEQGFKSQTRERKLQRALAGTDQIRQLVK